MPSTTSSWPRSAFSGVILVIDSRGYHVRAYDVPKVIADNVDPILVRRLGITTMTHTGDQ